MRRKYSFQNKIPKCEYSLYFFCIRRPLFLISEIVKIAFDSPAPWLRGIQALCGTLFYKANAWHKQRILSKISFSLIVLKNIVFLSTLQSSQWYSNTIDYTEKTDSLCILVKDDRRWNECSIAMSTLRHLVGLYSKNGQRKGSSYFKWAYK